MKRYILFLVFSFYTVRHENWLKIKHKAKPKQNKMKNLQEYIASTYEELSYLHVLTQ